jgi:hypothetical protein
VLKLDDAIDGRRKGEQFPQANRRSARVGERRLHRHDGEIAQEDAGNGIMPFDDLLVIEDQIALTGGGFDTIPGRFLAGGRGCHMLR